ncbi:phage protein D [Desulfocucumis palustris]|uniref:Phage protein D n=1 Tax=Desulfocucumis palustris TaxID=1898651 RepID=A0A2L2XCT3_9FIRM|nr:phage late control D family protein [Desulfocucumis palustris]GBF34149.1 phage protein D [Desulfocucumis palustris]
MEAPRAAVEVAGVDVRWTDLVDLEFENTLYLAADSFEATFKNELLLSDWLRKRQEVKLYLGYVKDPNNWTKNDLSHMFTGTVDGLKANFGNGTTVKIICRDYSAPMIDTEYSVAYAQRTSSQLAALFGKKYGLKPVVTATTVIVDKELYENKKEWEVLQALADLEGFVCYVTREKELYFGPRKEDDENIVSTLYYRVPGQANCEIEFDDSEIGVINKVTIRHWMGKNKRLIEASAVNQSLLKAMGGQVKERVIYESKAKTVALAQQFADRKLKELSRSVVTGTGRTFGNPLLIAEKRVETKGFGRLEGAYYIEKARHSYSKSGGYTTTFDITNLRPDNAQQYRQDLYDNNAKVI